MTISRMGISSLMGFENGGDVFDPQEFLRQQKEKNFTDSFQTYQQRLAGIQGATQPVTGFDIASKIGAGILAEQGQKFPSLGRGIGIGFQSLSQDIEKRRADKKKEEQAVAMKAMELALQDEQQAEKFLNDYSLKLIELANKPIQTTTLDTSMLIDAIDADGNPLLNPQTGVGYKEKTTLRANDPLIDELLKQGATVIDTASTSINLAGAGNKLDELRAKNIAENEATWQKEADAANAIRQQVAIARGIAEQLGEENFGAVDAATLGLKRFILDLGFEAIVDRKVIEKQEELTQTSIGFVMALVGKTKGAISNREMDIFFAASPTLASTYGGYMNMLSYMDRIAELTERYNEEWQNRSIELQGEPISVINAEFAKFKREFQNKPENRLFQTEEEKNRLKEQENKPAFNNAVERYNRIVKDQQKTQEEDSKVKLKTDIIERLAEPNIAPEEKERLEGLLKQIDEMG
jgi:hypothetical protein